ncbi:MAG: hypothetical protein AB7G87_04905 [Clostridia bacterium]
MPSEIISKMIGFFIALYLTLIIIFGSLHYIVTTVIDSWAYDLVEKVVTKGELSREVYNKFQDRIALLGTIPVIGPFDIYLKSEIDMGEDDSGEQLFDIYYDGDDIINRKYKIGDYFSCYIESRHPTVFSNLINMTMFFVPKTKRHELYIVSLNSGMVVNDAQTGYSRGYNIISDIKKHGNTDDVAVLVKTLINPTGKYYGLASHPDVTVTDIAFGDDNDEQYPNDNYIFAEGFFKRVEEYYGDGSLRLIIYAQE